MTVQSVASMDSGMQQFQVKHEINAQVVKMMLDTVEAQGEAKMEMMDAVKDINPEHLGTYLDVLV